MTGCAENTTKCKIGLFRLMEDAPGWLPPRYMATFFRKIPSRLQLMVLIIGVYNAATLRVRDIPMVHWLSDDPKIPNPPILGVSHLEAHEDISTNRREDTSGPGRSSAVLQNVTPIGLHLHRRRDICPRTKKRKKEGNTK